MNKVLFLVHCEEAFRRFFPDDLFPLRLRRSALAHKYNRVILLDSETQNFSEDGIIKELVGLGLETWHWSWGYERNCWYDDDEDHNWVIDSKGHECTWVPVEIRDELSYFRVTDIYIGGGYDGECLADWESVLEYLDLDYTRVNGLIYP